MDDGCLDEHRKVARLHLLVFGFLLTFLFTWFFTIFDMVPHGVLWANGVPRPEQTLLLSSMWETGWVKLLSRIGMSYSDATCWILLLGPGCRSGLRSRSGHSVSLTAARSLSPRRTDSEGELSGVPCREVKSLTNELSISSSVSSGTPRRIFCMVAWASWIFIRI